VLDKPPCTSYLVPRTCFESDTCWRSSNEDVDLRQQIQFRSARSIPATGFGGAVSGRALGVEQLLKESCWTKRCREVTVTLVDDTELCCRRGSERSTHRRIAEFPGGRRRNQVLTEWWDTGVCVGWM
jgi:hypothetical protein